MVEIQIKGSEANEIQVQCNSRSRNSSTRQLRESKFNSRAAEQNRLKFKSEGDLAVEIEVQAI